MAVLPAMALAVLRRHGVAVMLPVLRQSLHRGDAAAVAGLRRGAAAAVAVALRN